MRDEPGVQCHRTDSRPVLSLHYPIAKISELADIFIPEEDGGILTKTGVVDVFYNLRETDEASFCGGEFIIVKCENEKNVGYSERERPCDEQKRKNMPAFTILTTTWAWRLPLLSWQVTLWAWAAIQSAVR